MRASFLSEGGGAGAPGGTAASERLNAINEFVAQVVGGAGFELSVDVRIEDDAIVVALDGPDASIMLDRKGEVLDAMQVILSKTLPRLFDITERIVVDSENYRKGREREISEIARLTADKVKQLGTACELSPMNPYERRIVHLALKDDQLVTTESAGEGFIKRVTIYPSRPSPK